MRLDLKSQIHPYAVPSESPMSIEIHRGSKKGMKRDEPSSY